MRRFWIAAVLLTALGCMGGMAPGERPERPGGRPGGPPGRDGPPGAGRVPAPLMAIRGQLTELTFQSGGRERSAFVHVPDGADNEPLPVVVMMHGGATVSLEKGRTMAPTYVKHFDEDVVFVFPNSIYESVRPWFGPEDGDEAMRDIRYVHDAIDEVAKQVSIDRSRLYLSGFSAGAGFAWYASCVDAEYWRGFAMMSCSFPDMLSKICQPSVMKPIFYLHGTADRVIPFDGDPEIAKGGAPRSMDWVLKTRQCEQKPDATPSVPGEGGIVAKGAVHTCREVPDVELWRAEGQDHCVAIAGGRCGGYDTSDLIFAYWKRSAGL